jgi:hypothetical protein
LKNKEKYRNMQANLNVGSYNYVSSSTQPLKHRNVELGGDRKSA